MYAYAQSKGRDLRALNTAKLQTLRNDEMRELLDRSRHGDKGRARQADLRQSPGWCSASFSALQAAAKTRYDLFQVGGIGLIKAIDNFDPSHEVMFSTYGVPMISGEVKALPARQQRRARQPLHARHRLPRDAGEGADHERKGARAEHHRDRGGARPAARGRRDRAGVDRRAPFRSTSRSFPTGGDTIYIMDQNQGRHDGRRLARGKSRSRRQSTSWSPREKKILSMRFIDGKTQTEVAEEIGITLR